MKFNWGTALFIFFVIYIGLLVRIVIKSKSIDHTLVVENYYQHDIDYQKKVDKINNRSLLEDDLQIKYLQAKNQISFDFGDNFQSVKKASVQMYRASDKSLDFTKSIEQITGNIFEMDLPKLKHGRWKIKISWEDEARAYLKEQDIYISKA